jgi:hypothetical protein
MSLNVAVVFSMAQMDAVRDARPIWQRRAAGWLLTP